MLRSITTARYTMRATILRPSDPTATEPVDPNVSGQWVQKQSVLTGEVIRVWEPAPVDDTATPENELDYETNDIWCMARGIVDGGVRAAATTESFDDIYRNVDIINLWVPRKYRVTKADRITNIRTKDGEIMWRDEEIEKAGEVRATVFNVNGVIPVLDPFSRPIDNFCLLERAEI